MSDREIMLTVASDEKTPFSKKGTAAYLGVAPQNPRSSVDTAVAMLSDHRNRRSETQDPVLVERWQSAAQDDCRP